MPRIKTIPQRKFNKVMSAQKARHSAAVQSGFDKAVAPKITAKTATSGATKATAKKGALGLSTKGAVAAGLGAAHLASAAAVAKRQLEDPKKTISRSQKKSSKAKKRLQKKILRKTKRINIAKSKADAKEQKRKAFRDYTKTFVDHYIDLKNFIIEQVSLDEKVSGERKGAAIGYALGSVPGYFAGKAIGRATMSPKEKIAYQKYKMTKKVARANKRANLAKIRGQHKIRKIQTK